MSNEIEAKDVLPKFLSMIDSNLQMTTHHLNQAVAVAVKAENDRQGDIARMYVELDEYYKAFKIALRGIYD